MPCVKLPPDWLKVPLTRVDVPPAFTVPLMKLLPRYNRILTSEGRKPVPEITADTVVLVLPVTGDMEETVATALRTTNWAVSLLPSGFRTTRFQVPGAAP